jgi:hypothetical protein
MTCTKTRRLWGALIGALIVGAIGARPIRAQDGVDARTMPIHLGPLGLAPVISVSSGIDTNVLNDASNVKQDVVTTLAPQTRAALKLARVRIDAQGLLAAERFSTFANLNSTNVSGTATVGVNLNRLSPYATETIVRSRERAGFEIDTRPRRTQHATTLGLDVRVASKLTLGASTYRSTNRYDADVLFRGANLQQELDRDSQVSSVWVRQPLSALTTLSVTADRVTDHFVARPTRDADSVRVGAGLTFKSTALLNGGFNVGYLSFAPRDRAVDRFRGLVTAADLGYVLLGVTRFAFRADRHVDYSYAPETPYYVLTGGTVSITQRAGERWSLWGSAGRYRLSYLQTAPGAAVPPVFGPRALPPSDDATQFGAGLTLLINGGTEVGVGADHLNRVSPIQTRNFQATRAKVTFLHRF